MGSTVVSTGLDVIQQERQHNSELLNLRALLKELQAWPEAGDEYLSLLPEVSQHPPPPSASDRDWLPQVVEACLNGVDIGFHFPAFFQRLLGNPRLRRVFLAELRRELHKQQKLV